MNSTKKFRDTMLIVTALCVAVSWSAAHFMHGWFLPTDYWLLWASIITGVGGVPCAIIFLCAHYDYLKETPAPCPGKAQETTEN